MDPWLWQFEDVGKRKRPAAAPAEGSLSAVYVPYALIGTHLWLTQWGRIMGKRKKPLSRMGRHETLLLLHSKRYLG
jgi:hypothetical protein